MGTNVRKWNENQQPVTQCDTTIARWSKRCAFERRWSAKPSICRCRERFIICVHLQAIWLYQMDCEPVTFNEWDILDTRREGCLFHRVLLVHGLNTVLIRWSLVDQRRTFWYKCAEALLFSSTFRWWPNINVFAPPPFDVEMVYEPKKYW